MTQPITLLGATGSIGRSTLDVVEHYSDRFHIHAIAGGNRVDELVEVAAHVHPKHVVIANPVLEGELREKLSAAGLTSVNVGAHYRGHFRLSSVSGFLNFFVCYFYDFSFYS